MIENPQDFVERLKNLTERVGAEFRAIRAETAKGLSVVASGNNFRAWSDGRVEAWGEATIASGDGTQVVLPITFPNGIQNFNPVALGDVSVSFSVTIDSDSTVTVKHNGNGGVSISYHAISN